MKEKNKKNSDMETCAKVVPIIGEVQYSCSKEESEVQKNTN